MTKECSVPWSKESAEKDEECKRRMREFAKQFEPDPFERCCICGKKQCRGHKP